VTVGEYEHNLTLSEGELELYWTIVNGTARIALRGHTTGWISLGISPVRYMNGSDMLVGYVTGSGGAFVIDAYCTGDYGPHPADLDLHGTDDLLDRNATEVGGWTTVELVRNLTTADPYDKPIPEAGVVAVLWGISPSDDIVTQHTRYGKSSWNTSGGTAPPRRRHRRRPTAAGRPRRHRGRQRVRVQRLLRGGDLQLHWKVKEGKFHLAVVARTTGWVSIGLEPSQR